MSEWPLLSTAVLDCTIVTSLGVCQWYSGFGIALTSDSLFYDCLGPSYSVKSRNISLHAIIIGVVTSRYKYGKCLYNYINEFVT